MEEGAGKSLMRVNKPIAEEFPGSRSESGGAAPGSFRSQRSVEMGACEIDPSA